MLALRGWQQARPVLKSSVTLDCSLRACFVCHSTFYETTCLPVDFFIVTIEVFDSVFNNVMRSAFRRANSV